ncbi:MAG: TIM44-like domain-containing protein [Deltaproteobacteria bacterium]|nr:TIM44-like domain-containing protein [Deltaproteobacteria bacterium]
MTSVKRRWVTLAVVGGLVLVLVELALARPGGGHSYSGGGGHSRGGSSGGGDGGGFLELIYWLIRLLIEFPQVGVPVLICVIGYFAYSSYKQHANKDWDSGPPVVLERAIDLSDLRRIDPDFSQVLFEDFAFRLFSTAHRLRHSEETLAQVAPYVGNDARFALQTRPPAGVPAVSVVVGAMRVTHVDLPGVLAEGATGRVNVNVELEANVTTADKTYYSVELWRFSRDGTRTTKPPASKNFPCPNCGAPWQSAQTGTQVCASCGETVDNGRFDWVVEKITLRSIDERPPALLGNVEERGTDLETYRQEGVDQNLIALGQADPAVTESTLLARLHLIYDQLNRSWAANDLNPVRGLVSDGLYDYLAYWIEAYKRQDLRNELVDMRITHHAWAKVSRDRWYDAVTVRIWATGKDFTALASTGQVLKGSSTRERKYSEYWTLIRSASRKGAPLAEPKCSNCGAPLQITMAGECAHCNAHITAGEFDWVLSKIEQDDSYRG